MKRGGLISVLAWVVLLLLATGAWAQVTVSNLEIAQRPGTKLVDIRYDVSKTGPGNIMIALTASNAGVRVNMPSLTGDVGSVGPGTGKSIVWNMGADWNGNLAVLSIYLTANDDVPSGGDPTAVGWIVVNAKWVRNIYANGAITMNDRNTGLMWVYDVSTGGARNWNSAVTYCNNLNYAGYSDWRLPYIHQPDGSGGTVRPGELEAMYNQITYFTGSYGDSFWSGTTYTYDTISAWYAFVAPGGYIDVANKSYYTWNTWPVRTWSAK